MSIRKLLFATVLLAPTIAISGDLVLKLGTANDPRIPITGLVTVSPASGDVIVDPIANNGTAGDGWCPSGGGTGVIPTFTTAFSASPDTLAVGGGQVTLTWAASNASSCTASASPAVAGWSGTVGTSGPVTVNVTSSGNYTFSLFCTGTGGNTATFSDQLTVQSSGGTPTACTGRPAPTGLSRGQEFINSGVFYHNSNKDLPAGGAITLLRHDPVLGAFGTTENAYIPIYQNNYIAMEFNTSSVAVGTIGTFEWEQPSQNGAPITVMLSPCPGDFQWVTEATCKTGNAIGYGAINWHVTSGTAQAGTCKLLPNTTYYVNAAFVNPTGYTTSSCGAGNAYCIWFVSAMKL